MKFKRKPLIVEAFQWDGSDHRGMFEFLDGNHRSTLTTNGTNFHIDHSKVNGGLIIKTNEGDMAASIGDWIIKEPFPTSDRKFYPCKLAIFEKTYSPVSE
jgi:hypothetical protein